MSTLTESIHDEEFIVSEANRHRSRDDVTMTSGAFMPGEVMGKITASGKFTAWDPAAADGSENAAGINIAGIDASAADKTGALLIRDAEVNEDLLTFDGGANAGEITTAKAQLVALGIIIRKSI